MLGSVEGSPENGSLVAFVGGNPGKRSAGGFLRWGCEESSKVQGGFV